MNWTGLIVSVNVALYFMQFLFMQHSMYFFSGLIFINLLAGLISFALENKELSKVFLLSAIVVALIGPVLLLAGGIIIGALCFGLACFSHH